MIEITDLKGGVHQINADMIESIHSNPDTQVILQNGHRYYARETPKELVARIVRYKQLCFPVAQMLETLAQQGKER